jgi:splicing factor 3B subunit 3
MIGAVEKQKFVYILNRDTANKLTISSPLEAHKAHTLVYGLIGVDVGFDNPIFACIELDYIDADQDPTGEAAVMANKVLTYYELDLGLNHVVRKSNDVIDPGANMLIAVPGAKDGPGGVLVCCENKIMYKKPGNDDEVMALIPRREGLSNEVSLLIISAATHRQKDMFFFLIQSEFGDIYKVMLDYVKDTGVVTNINIKYFDTVPLAVSLCVLKTGFLFVAAEFGNHMLYQFQGIGDDEEGEDLDQTIEIDGEEIVIPFFRPRPLKNLLPIDECESLAPITHMQVMDLANEDTPQIYSACGKGTRSSLRVLRHGLPLTEMAVSELPGNPNGVWTVKKHRSDEYDTYIIVSFPNATLVLSIGETVEEVTDSGFLATSPTLNVTLLGDDALVQVHPSGIRHIRADKRINEWKPPGKKTIVKAALNERQVIIALTGGEIIYFELDAPGNLIEVEKKDLAMEASCVDVGPIPEGRQRSRFLAVGGWDNTVRILSLDPEDCLTILSTQALPALAESLAVVEMERKGSEAGIPQLYLNVGLQSGVFMRTAIDSVTGVLSDTRTRFLGNRPIRLFKVTVRESTGVLALSSRSWLCYDYLSRFHLVPLSYEMLEYASNFASDQCPEGLVSICGNTLRILTVERLGEVFNQQIIPVRYTPRRWAVHPSTSYLVTIETDNNALTLKEESKALQELMTDADAPPQVHPDFMNYKGVPNEDMPRSVYGISRAGVGTWASCIRVLNAVAGETLSILELENNEAAFSICTVKFHDRDELFLAVGTAKDLQLQPRSCTSGFIHLYRFVDEARKLELVHKTPVDDLPTAMTPFQGRLIVTVGKVLRIYDMGKRKLLRKCEQKNFPNFLVSVCTSGDRVIVGDVAESFHFVKYKRAENQLNIFADDNVPRWVSCYTQLDHDSLAGADKFGNIFVLRLPQEVSEDIEDDPTGSVLKWDVSRTGSAAHKVDAPIHFHVGETIQSMSKTTLQAGGMEAIVYTTVLGGVGALVPFSSREDVEFFQHLEMHMRQENPPITGRDHLSFRSYYHPVKEVVDGDLCEQFTSLDAGKQKMVAEELDRTPGEIAKKLEDMRNRIL